MSVAMIGPKFYAWDRNGKPLAFGKLYTYQARTNVPKDTYQSEDQVVPNTNPVILNGEGYADVYLSGSYKMVLKDDKDNEIWSSDPVSANELTEWKQCLTATYISPTSLKVSGNFIDTYSPGSRVRIDNNASEYSYSTVVSSVYAANETTITITDSVITTGVQEVCVSVVSQESLPERNPDNVEALKELTLPSGTTLSTKGYYSKNDGGQAAYLIKTNTEASNDGDVIDGFINHQLQGDTVAILLFSGVLNIRQCGAFGSGTDDDTQAIQAAFSYIKSGDSLYFSKGNYKFSSQLTMNTENVRIYGGGKLIESVELVESILITDADNVKIEGLEFEGIEDLTSWLAGDSSYRQEFKYFIRFTDCKNGVVRDIQSSKKRGTVLLSNCQKMTVQGVRHNGFLGDISTPQPDSNYYPVVNVSTGRENHIHSCEGFSCGSVVLLGLDSSYNTVSKITGRETHDNMIYNSSGNYSSFMNCVSDASNGSGIKARGRGHTVTGNVLTNSGVGIDVTGNGVDPDNFGANGFGTVVSANTVVASRTHGIKMGGQDGLRARDFIIIGNTVEAHTGVDGFCPITAAAERGVIVKGNIVRGFSSDYAINVSGISSNELPDCSIEGNIIQGGADGIRCQYLNRSILSNNQGEGLTGELIDLRFCDDNTIIGNNDKDSNIAASDTYPSTGNIFIGNKVNLISTNNETNKVVVADFDHNYSYWSPTYETTGVDFDSITLGTTQGFYVKNGNMVYIEGVIEVSALTIGSASGAVIIGNLPFTSSNAGAGAVATLGVARVSGFNVNHPSNCWIARNTDYIQLEYRPTSNGGTATLVPADMNPAGINRIMFSGVYFVD